MGIVINQRIVRKVAYHGNYVIGAAYHGRLVWRNDVSQFSIDPDSIRFDNDAYQQSKEFVLVASGDWVIEEIF